MIVTGVDEMVLRAHEAMIDQDWSTLRILLHPYLHWTANDGVTVRGRMRVLEYLQRDGAPADPPAAYELRDGQVYRWQV